MQRQRIVIKAHIRVENSEQSPSQCLLSKGREPQDEYRVYSHIVPACRGRTSRLFDLSLIVLIGATHLAHHRYQKFYYHSVCDGGCATAYYAEPFHVEDCTISEIQRSARQLDRCIQGLAPVRRILRSLQGRETKSCTTL